MASFTHYIPLLISAEGGYQEDPNDKYGNYNSKGELVGTRWGISAPTLENWQGYPPTKFQMQYLAKETALKIHEKLFWDKLKANKIINQKVAELIVDHGINAGVSRAADLVQKTLNTNFNTNLQVDGHIGNITLNAINTVNQDDLYRYYFVARKNYYKSLNNSYWLQGWLNRLNNLAKRHGKNVTMLLKSNKASITTAFVLIAFASVVYYNIKKYK